MKNVSKEAFLTQESSSQKDQEGMNNNSKSTKNKEKLKNAIQRAVEFIKKQSPYMNGGILVGLGLGFMVHNPLAGLLLGIGGGYILEQIFVEDDSQK